MSLNWRNAHTLADNTDNIGKYEVSCQCMLMAGAQHLVRTNLVVIPLHTSWHMPHTVDDITVRPNEPDICMYNTYPEIHFLVHSESSYRAICM